MSSDNWEKRFWTGLFRESDGTPSFARIGSLLILVGVLTWITHVTWHDHKLPDLGSATSFTTTSLLSLYGTNKAASAISGLFNK